MWTAYLERYRTGEWRDRILHDMILADAARLGEQLTFLDIGCGRGFDGDEPLQQSLAQHAGTYIGVEPDLEVQPASFLTEVHRCRFEDAPIPSGTIDVAFAVMVLEHLEAPQQFWDKLWDVLRDGGIYWGITVDARHWFCRASWWAERLRVKDLYLNHVLGRRGSERYENYPVHYRCNTPEQIKRYVGRFRSCEFINFSRVGQLNPYFSKALHGVANFLDRRALKQGKPGTLLAIRVVK